MRHESFDALIANAAGLVSTLIERWFGPAALQPLFANLTAVDLAVFACFLLLALLLNGVAAAWLRRKIRSIPEHLDSKEWRVQLFVALAKPLYAAIWICGIYLALAPVLLKLTTDEPTGELRRSADQFLDLGLSAVLFWSCFRLTRVLEARLSAWAARAKTTTKIAELLVPVLGRSLRIVLPVVAVILVLPLLNLPPQYANLVSHGSSILIIAAVASILSQTVHLGERAVLTKYDLHAADNLQARKVYTQVHVISKTLYFLIALFTVASVLMLFEEVRRFGASILASAGVLGVILGFAAQRTIANLFAGFQLAMTQPIRIDDVVVVEGEYGNVEEITLTYVVIHLWDDRRLVVPLSYFIEKPFQNWTRASASILGSVFFWADYTLPIAEIRKALQQILEATPLWDHRFWNLQVTDVSDHAMQLRVLATAADSAKAWDLRCEIREKLIDLIQRKFPQSLPRSRQTSLNPNSSSSSTAPTRPEPPPSFQLREPPGARHPLEVVGTYEYD